MAVLACIDDNDGFYRYRIDAAPNTARSTQVQFALTFVVGKQHRDRLLFDLLTEQIDLIQEHHEGRFHKELAVDNCVEQIQRFLHTILQRTYVCMPDDDD